MSVLGSSAVGATVENYWKGWLPVLEVMCIGGVTPLKQGALETAPEEGFVDVHCGGGGGHVDLFGCW